MLHTGERTFFIHQSTTSTFRPFYKKIKEKREKCVNAGRNYFKNRALSTFVNSDLEVQLGQLDDCDGV